MFSRKLFLVIAISFFLLFEHGAISVDLPPFEIENAYLKTEIEKIGITFSPYEGVLDLTALRDVNTSNYYFYLREEKSNNSFTINGLSPPETEMKFPYNKIIHKGEKVSINFSVRFTEVRDYFLLIFQGEHTNSPLEIAVLESKNERGKDRIDITIVTPDRYRELLYQKYLVDNSKEQLTTAQIQAETAQSQADNAFSGLIVSILLAAAAVASALIAGQSARCSKDLAEASRISSEHTRNIALSLKKTLEESKRPFITISFSGAPAEYAQKEVEIDLSNPANSNLFTNFANRSTSNTCKNLSFSIKLKIGEETYDIRRGSIQLIAPYAIEYLTITEALIYNLRQLNLMEKGKYPPLTLKDLSGAKLIIIADYGSDLAEQKYHIESETEISFKKDNYKFILRPTNIKIES